MFLDKFYEDLYEGEDDYVSEDVMMGQNAKMKKLNRASK